MNHGLMKSQTLFYAKRGGVQPIDADNFAREIDSIPTAAENIVIGTFVTPSTRYEIIDINIGFQPDFVFVTLPIVPAHYTEERDTACFWISGQTWSLDYAFWNLQPYEGHCYQELLGRTDGETGIQQINSNGFSFIVSGANTLEKTCNYVCVKF